MLWARRMGDWIHKLRDDRPRGAGVVPYADEDEDRGHMSASEIGKLRVDAGADEGSERWVTSVAVSDPHGDRAKLAITIELGPSGLPPGVDAQLKIAGGEPIPGTHFRVTVAGGSCFAVLDVGEQAPAILQAHALGRLVAVFTKWEPPRRQPSDSR